MQGRNHIAALVALLCLSMAGAVTESRGYYRIPYKTGTKVRVTNDVDDHSPIGRIDMSGRSGTTYQIVAAASGWVRYIEDGFTGQTSSPVCKNNYVWLEHPNGEWTKYSHMTKDSATTKAGLYVGLWVPMGTFLGDEGAVGCASGDHLHFEVAVVRANNPITTIGGFVLDNSGSKRNRDPRICGISGGLFQSGKEYVASWQPTNYISGAAEVAQHGLPLANYQCFFNQLRDARYELVWLDMFNNGRRVYVNAVARKRTGSGYGFHGADGKRYQVLYDRLKKGGFRPVMVDSYVYRGKVHYAGYFKKTSGPSFAGYHGLSQSAHQTKFNTWVKIGYFPTSLSVVSVGGDRKYTAIYEKQSQGSIIVKSTLLVSQYQAAFDANNAKGRRVAYLNGYNHNGKAYLVTIFNSVTPSGGKYRHGMSGSSYQTEYDSARSDGLLTRIVTGYADQGSRYAAGWR